VATPRLTVRFPQLLTVLVIAIASIGVFPATSNAAPQLAAPRTPTTASDAREQLAQLSEQAEIVAEQYNDARVTLAKRKAEFRTADRQAKAVQRQYAVLAGQIRRVVSAAYMNVPFGQLTMLLTSSSPADFVDQISTLRLLAIKRGALIDKVARVRAESDAAQSRAQAALAAQQKITKDIAAKTTDLKRRKVQLEALVMRLSAQERAQLLSASADRASRSTTRPAPAPVVGPASSAAQKAVQVALAQRGDPYSWGAAGPDAFDCSGLTMYAWAAAGVSLPHSSSSQYGVGMHVSRSEVRAGDLVFFYSPIHHVGIAISNTEMVHAPTYGQVVQVASIDSSPYVGATRVG
jgi:cell wall-associated NlpC family hydrolase